MAKQCLSSNVGDRLSLANMKRILMELFPEGAAVLTMTDAIGIEAGSENESRGFEDTSVF
eukprot:MONOS_14197.1-p1 / transcript=MONOS_14197.1 / gene=MONOS_14197 / organism=Monocercomonoides_exilis_PA203 / gene_product=unspecified product / transcript_product=unspecified product / location=Mono_scaffold00954:50-229(+) / protein_length=60 / sequence_SO=supercontig / SO=protein_coding / is_pseudo=false